MIMYLIAVPIILILLYLYGTRNYNYWAKKGVKHGRTVPFFGTWTRVFLQKISMSEYLAELYNNYPNEKVVGHYLANELGLVIRDPELIKHVLVTDFHYFHPRGLNPNKDVIEPMMKGLFTVDGDTWKLLRQRLTPAFTSGKLKAMFPLIVERAEKLQNIAATAAESGKEVDVRDLMARYTTDFIGACGFGIDSDSLNDENSTFRRIGKRIFTVTMRDTIVFILKQLGPDMFKHLHFFGPEVTNDTISLVKQIMQQRDYKPSGRNDFIDLLLELKQKGKIVGESVEKRNSDGTAQIVELEMDEVLMAAQVFVFFAAGFETSSSASSYTLHQLAYYPEAQRKCQEEIDEVLNRHGGKLSYDAVKEMKYLEMCFKEGMRVFPSLGFLSRECVKRYTLPGTDVTIDEKVWIGIPIHALQTDPQYFDDPNEFKPERFHPDNINNIKKHIYLPFGEGPRACIGERLGLMQSLAGLAAILSRFSVAPSESTLRHPVIDPKSQVVQVVKNGIPLALTARKLPLQKTM